LGKGAYGDVLKVRNKLDGGVYAIKRIELNPKNKQLNRKITREVKLLSRLNHENVVRYYNSWIESATLDDSTRYSRFTPSITPSIKLISTSDDKTSSADDVS
jgi:translation initiation factor 2-alpha kinase 4